MTAHSISRGQTRRRPAGSFRVLPAAVLVVLLAATGSLVAYMLWPTWPSSPVALDAPSVPVTVAGVLFDVPPAAVRVPVQRHAGPHERIDLVFVWPSLEPPTAANAVKPTSELTAADGNGERPARAAGNDRLFVTIAALGRVLPPIERLRTIYPRYVEPQGSAGPDGLAVLSFRAGSPYAGEDLVFFGEKPEQFFARCTRDIRAVQGTCLNERALDAAEITLRFPRDWLAQWRSVSAGIDRLIAELHPQERPRKTDEGAPATDDR